MKRKLELHEIKKLSFEVLCAVRDICREHGISYSLTGGTLIGAVRHKGFIPWDDDIDIMIPRPDYDRFVSIVKEGKYPAIRLLAEETVGKAYPYPFAKACHPKTELSEHLMNQSGLALGVYVDIFPVDGIADTYRGARLRTKMFQVIHGLKVTSNWTRFRRSKLRKWYYEPFRYVCYLISKMLSRNRIDKMLDRFVRKKKYSETAYAGRLVGDFGSKEIMPRSLFDEKVQLEFEGELFDAVADYDRFLTSLYGDYMTMPPVEKRVTHHEYDAYYID